MGKDYIANIIACVITLIGLLFEEAHFLFTIGLFSLSGALTNTLAIHMLFEKVPFLYGSGVIEDRFEGIKESILRLIMDEFFTKESIKDFFKDKKSFSKIDLSPLFKKVDFSFVFDSLKQGLLKSNFGSMISMMGGEKVIDSLKDIFIGKLQTSFSTLCQKQEFVQNIEQIFSTDSKLEDIHTKIEHIIKDRLNTMTPKDTKKIIENVIKDHLGWLVVWGAFFGGIIGTISLLLV